MLGHRRLQHGTLCRPWGSWHNPALLMHRDNLSCSPSQKASPGRILHLPSPAEAELQPEWSAVPGQPQALLATAHLGGGGDGVVAGLQARQQLAEVVDGGMQ